jgi:hypothetical protein
LQFPCVIFSEHLLANAQLVKKFRAKKFQGEVTDKNSRDGRDNVKAGFYAQTDESGLAKPHGKE